MIVIAIIGILASIAIPTYQNYIQETADNACMAEATAYAKRVYTDIQLNRPTTETLTPIASACQEINNGSAVTTATSFTATAKMPGKATINCDLATEVVCSKTTPTP